MSSAQWKYPALAKPDSDGAYTFHIQRRISAPFSVRLTNHISPNTATGIDLAFGLGAALLVGLDYWILGVVFIQIFGVFSCVDGEIARIQNRPSRMGDLLDTLTDRLTELFLIGAISWSLFERVDSVNALLAGFGYLAGVFLLTTSSEKFRSAWKMDYPKRKLERLFSLFCAGSDSRLLMLSVGLLASELSGNPSILLWLFQIWTVAMGLNFALRIGLIYHHFNSENKIES